MKLDQNYLKIHQKEISQYLYGYCLSDQIIDKKSYQKSQIYKFNKNKQIIEYVNVFEVTGDRRTFICKKATSLSDEQYSKFYIIGDLFDLIRFIESDRNWEDIVND